MLLDLCFSSCPNDLYIFSPWAFDLLKDKSLRLQNVSISSIDQLNKNVFMKKPAVTKVSYALLPLIKDNYKLLKVGSAVSSKSGPKLVSRYEKNYSLKNMSHLKIILPGQKTTAELIFKKLFPQAKNILYKPFYDLIPSLEREEGDMAVLIHEEKERNRSEHFYPIMDLAQAWFEKTKTPLPLGCVVARRDLGPLLIEEIEKNIYESLTFSQRNPEIALKYMQKYAQEKDPQKIWKHVDSFINKDTFCLSGSAQKAIHSLWGKFNN